MRLLLNHILYVVVFSLANLRIVAKCAQNGVSALFLAVFGHFLEDIVSREAKIFD